jgi:hypothetical protein
VSDLANPKVSLSKLARSVPHGYRGEKLVDMLVAKEVPVTRSVWYIRVLGAHEIVSSSRTVEGDDLCLICLVAWQEHIPRAPAYPRMDEHTK